MAGKIRKATINDAAAICDIYNYYVKKTTITFETEDVSITAMQSRIQDTDNIIAWFVYELDNKVIGYAYASKWKGRCAYRYSVETTVYLDSSFFGKGIGQLLLDTLLQYLCNNNYHVAIAGITIENANSIRLHEKNNFIKVAHFKEVGYKFDTWLDVGYWELLLPNKKE